jgi:RNA polymerase sigma-70 factor (ECF subfamily)
MNPKQAAVRDVLRRERRRLAGVVRRAAGEAVDADEVLQEAALRALSRAESLSAPARASAWVARIVERVALDALRARRPVVPIEDLELPSEPAPEEACGCAAWLLSSLAREQARLLRRVAIDEVPVGRTAAELGVRPGTAMVRLHRAKRALRARLAEHCGVSSLRQSLDCACAGPRCGSH